MPNGPPSPTGNYSPASLLLLWCLVGGALGCGCGFPGGSITLRSSADDFQMAMLRASTAQQDRIERVLELLMQVSRSSASSQSCPICPPCVMRK